MTAQLLQWHRPKIEVLETVGPLRCCKMFTLHDGRRIIIPGTPPIVTIEFNAELLVKTLQQCFGSGRIATAITSKRVAQRAVKYDPLWLALGGRDDDPTYCLNSHRISDRLSEIEGRPVDIEGKCYALKRDPEASKNYQNYTVWYVMPSKG